MWNYGIVGITVIWLSKGQVWLLDVLGFRCFKGAGKEVKSGKG